MTDEVILVPGAFEYVDSSQTTQTLLFQFNPSSLKRSRTATFKQTKSNETQGTTTERGARAKKYSMTVERWKIDFELQFDTSKGTKVDREGKEEGAKLSSVSEALRHLEALIEPGPVPDSDDPTYGYQMLPDPPMVSFMWGDRLWRGFVTSLTITEIQFTPKLVPKRAEVAVSMVILETLDTLKARKVGGLR